GGMMRSVSTFGRSMGTATEVSVVKGSISRAIQGAHVGEPTCDRCRGRHRRAHEMCAHALSLSPLEVAVRGRGDALSGLAQIAVHADAHRAPGLAPLEPCGQEDTVEALA